MKPNMPKIDIISPYHSSECFVNRLIFQSPKETKSAYSKLFSPLRKTESLSSKRDQAVVTAIPLLFFPRSPSAILLTIVPVIINTIYCGIFLSKFFNMVKIRLVHVIMKFLKIFPKAFNAASTIAIITGICEQIASRNHRVIDNIKTIPRKTMCCYPFTGKFFPRTATRFCQITCEICSKNHSFFSTITCANRVRSLLDFISHHFSYFQSPKFLFYKINTFHVMNAKVLDALQVSSTSAVRLLIL